MERGLSAIGLLVMLGIAWLLSTNRSVFQLRTVVSGVLIQLFLGVLILWTSAGRWVFSQLRDLIASLVQISDVGAAMVFGETFRDHFFAFSVVSTIIVVSSLMSVLFYLGVMQRVVKGMAWVMMKLMGVSGSESLAASANVFIGQTEAPLVVLPYIGSMTRSELMALMTGGMATIAGSVMVAFVSFGADAGHLLAASIMSAPAALVIAKIMVPETEVSKTVGKVEAQIESNDTNVFDAACKGASDGMKLALNVVAMLIAFVSIAALINYVLGGLPEVMGEDLSVQRILGWVFTPMAWIMGIESSDVSAVSQLLGTKMFLNEFVAFLELKDLKETLSPRSFTIATYALCGFANFSSVAIQIGGVGALVPERRKDLAKLGLRAMIGGTLAANMTACVAGLLIA